MSDTPPITIPGLLDRQATARGGTVALRYKRRGLWRPVTYAELRDRVASTAAGLRRLGVEPGGTVALVAENSAEWIICDLAVQALGARSAAIPTQFPAETVAALIAASGATVVIGGDQEHVDVVIDAGAALAAVAALIVIDPTGTGGYEDARLHRFEELAAHGGDGLPAAGDPDAAALAMCTAGAHGPPRLVDHSGADVARLAMAVAEWLELGERDRCLTMISLAIPAARVVDVYAALAAGAEIAVPESPATTPNDLIDAEPTYLCATPRALELLRHTSDRRARESSRPRRRLYRRTIEALARRLDTTPTARTVAGATKGRGLRYALVGRFVANALGLRRTRRIVVTGGRAAARDARFFWALGRPVLSTYGQAENCGLAFAHGSLDDAATIGAPFAGAVARIESDGTLAIATAAAPEDWHRTGDLAVELGDGRVRVDGRREAATAGDRVVPVAALEAALRDSDFLHRAVVVPRAGGELTALVEVDFDEAAPWATDRDLVFSTYRSLVALPEVRAQVADEVRAAAARADDPITHLVVLPRRLSVAGGELTPLLTVRRDVIVAAFADEPAVALVPDA